MPNNTTDADNNNAANETTQWSCEACGCRTNTEAVNADSCAACGTSRRGIGSSVIRRRPPLPPASQIRRRVISRDRSHAMMNFEHHPSIGTDDDEEDINDGDIVAHQNYHRLQRHHHPHDTDDDDDDDTSSLLVDQEILESVFLGVSGAGGGGGVDHIARPPSTRAAIEALNAVVPPPPHDHQYPHQPNHHHHNQSLSDIRLDRITAIAAGRQFDPIGSTSSQPPLPPHLRYGSRPPPPPPPPPSSGPSMDNHDFSRDLRRAVGAVAGPPPPPIPSAQLDPQTLYRMASSEEGTPYNPLWSRKEMMGFVPIGGGGRGHIRPRAGGVPGRRHLDATGRRSGNIPTDISVTEEFPNVAFVYQRGNRSSGYGREGKYAVAQPPFTIRALDPASRGEDGYQEEGGAGPPYPFSSLVSTLRRRVFGFRVAFDHSKKKTGEIMGSYRLMVGIANSSNLMWGLEDNGRTFERVTNIPGGGRGGVIGGSIRQNENMTQCEYYRSRITGIEASRRGGRGSRAGRGYSLYSSSLIPNMNGGHSGGGSNTSDRLSSFPEANTDAVTPQSPPPPPPSGFGCRDVITVVVDLDSRTLTFWKNEVVLGTLVRNIPSSGSCFPIAGPLEAGVSVAITGMAGDPLAILTSFKGSQIKRREEQLHQRKLALSRQRDILIKNGNPNVPSRELIHALTNIFSWYITKVDVNCHNRLNFTDEMELTPIQATRLWYRCGIKLSQLENLLDESRSASTAADSASLEGEGGCEVKINNGQQETHVTLGDFLNLISRIVAEDEGVPKLQEGDDDRENENHEASSNAIHQSNNRIDGEYFQVGDYVEIVGNSSCGPLSSGDVGVVVETTNKAKGKTDVIRVKCNGRCWWYHPQALIPETTGLVESPTVQFLLKILRSHGYDENIQPLWGKCLTSDSWQEGDHVICSRNGKVSEKSTVGRIVEGVQSQPPTSFSSSAPEKSRLRASGMVLVECPNHLFGRSVSMLNNIGTVGPSSMALTRRIPFKNLRHTSFYHGLQINDETKLKIGEDSSITKGSFCLQNDDKDNLEKKVENDNASFFQFNDILRSSVDDVKRLDTATMEAFEKECKKNPASLPGLFGIGLSEAILSAIDFTADKMIRSIKCELNIPKIEGTSIGALGSLARCVCQHLFSRDMVSNLAISQMKERVRTAACPNLGDTVNPFFPSIGETDAIAFGSEVLHQESLHHNNQYQRQGNDHYNNRTRAFLQMLSGSQDTRSSIGTASIQLSRLPSDANEDEMQNERVGDFNMSRTTISSQDGQRSNSLGCQKAPNTSPAHVCDTSNAAASWPRFPSNERNNLDNIREKKSTTTESSIGIKYLPILQTLLRGSRVAIGSSDELRVASSQSNHVSMVAKSIINNGILTGDLQWVKRSFELQEYKSSKIDDAGGNYLCDEDGWPALLLAVSFGCSKMMVKALIEKGCQVTDSVIRKAAITNQAHVLSYLLQQTYYNEGTVDFTLCSNDVKNIIQGAIERQQEAEAKMRKEAGHFASSFLRKLLQLGLTIRLHSRRQGVSSYFHECSKAITNLLMSNVLFCALHSNQEEARVILSSDNSIKGKLSQDESQNLKQHLPDGLLHILPPEIFVGAFSTTSDMTDEQDSRSTAVIYLQLAESYLWSRDLSDISFGLSLARHFLATKPLIYADHIERYGIKELAISHGGLAKESLAQLDISKIAKNREHKSNPTSNHAVMCPKGHLAALHLTRHSDFRCNLCDKGVEKGHLMYGCRTCDWDACQSCMDRCEGGYVKWKLVHRLALECQQLISDIRDENLHVSAPTDVACSKNQSHFEKSVYSRNDEIQRISRGIRRLQTDSLKELSVLLHDRDRLTLFEFRNILLPSFHSALMGSDCPSTSRSIPEDEVKPDSYRRCKKPRLGGLSTTIFNMKDREDFMRAVIDALILDPIKGDSKKNQESTQVTSISSQNSACATVMDTEVVRMEIADNKKEEVASGFKGRGDNQEQNENNDGLLSRNQPLLVVPPILQYLHTILLFHERTTHVGTRDVGHGVCPISHRGGELHSLMIPFEVELQPSPSQSGTQTVESNSDYAIIHVEPLVSFSDFQMHILRSRPIQLASYSQFCRRLVIDQAVIAESSSVINSKGLGDGLGSFLRIARILDFDERSGAHLVKFASELISKERIRLNSCDIRGLLNEVDFDDDQLLVILAARDYHILYREESVNNQARSQMSMNSSQVLDTCNNLNNLDGDKFAFMLVPGTLVECKLDSHGDSWQPCTVKESIMVSPRRHENIIEKWPNDFRPSYTLVSNLGNVFSRVTSDKIRDHQSLLDRQHYERESWKTSTNIPQRMLFGQIDDRFSRHGRTNQTPHGFSEKPTLKRAWSALSLTQNLKPHDIDCPANPNHTIGAKRRLIDGNDTCGRNEAEYEDNLSMFEKPPQIKVNFSLHKSIPCISLNIRECTFFCALQHLLLREKSSQRQNLDHWRKCRLFYSFSWTNVNKTANESLPRTFSPPWTKSSSSWDETFATPDASSSIFERRNFNVSHTNRSRYFAKGSSGPKNLSLFCLGLDDSCLQTINMLCVMADRLSKVVELVPLNKENSFLATSSAQLLKMFESESLSKKLSDQMEGPMDVVAGALPEWCTVMPMYAPVLFSHASRRLFLNRYAFGVSRSLLRQQEAKVAVAHLRQRMSALRGRAVELVGEAFSGGASDPMALQLQADELYGMEEALKSRVNAAFRAQKWRERSLESVKAVIRRESLLSDAAFIMNNYSTASRLRKRRLEVRFEGESGFDAASGNEAGVTRGFYADVAEALLSCDNVSGIHLVSTFSKEECTPKSYIHREDLFSGSKRTKLPLWIPDVDPSNSIIIPSPRADRSTTLGIFPRPISHNHPQRKCVMEMFQLMGHLFAAAMRDGFTFPLPLSASFLKLVQGSDGRKRQNNMPDPILKAKSSSMSCESNMSDPFPLPSSIAYGSNLSIDSSNTYCSFDSGDNSCDMRHYFSYPFEECIESVDKCKLNRSLDRFHLKSGDLPRPGFLGGEVFAVEEHICKALDQLDSMEHMLSCNEFLRKKKELASDRSFAKRALGKSFACSFEEYFEDKTFVDPLDPTQGVEATPLCPHGHLCPVTIDNVREWVVLAKQFILHDGVIDQALAFRQGVNDFFPVGVLCLFTAEELQRDVCGGGDDVKNWNEDKIRSLLKLDGGKGATEALIAVAAMGGEGGAVLSRRFGPSSPTISYLMKTLLDANEFHRRQFLSFVTSVPIVTPGQIEVVPVVSPSGDFLPMSDPGCLPRANTCGRKLYLPKFNSYESFSEVLWAVVTAECRFKGFFEWRG